jgi:hypothetical protein
VFASSRHRIRVNAPAPDITLTGGIMHVAPPGSEKRFGLTVPIGRAGHVDGGTQASSGWYHHPDNGDYALGPSSV